jgi:Xaa-Pro aminopeptidase
MNNEAIKKISRALAGRSAFLAAAPSDVFYLTGALFEGVCALVAPSGDVFMAASRMASAQARDFFGDDLVVDGDSLSAAVVAAARKMGVRKISASALTSAAALFEAVAKKSAGKLRPTESADLSGLRAIKSPDEIAILRKNQRVARTAVEVAGRRALKKGVTERQVRRRIIEYFLRNDGDPAFDPIVAFGKNSAYPHHVAGTSRLAADDVVVIDAGFRRSGHASDLTRTYLLGKISDRKGDVVKIVKASQKSAISSVSAGAPCASIDAAARKAISERGFGGCFIHGTGHGLGIDVHEYPALRAKSRDILAAGMVVTVEPGIYIRGEFGARTEDAVVVTKKGCEVL